MAWMVWVVSTRWQDYQSTCWNIDTNIKLESKFSTCLSFHLYQHIKKPKNQKRKIIILLLCYSFSMNFTVIMTYTAVQIVDSDKKNIEKIKVYSVPEKLRQNVWGKGRMHIAYIMISGLFRRERVRKVHSKCSNGATGHWLCLHHVAGGRRVHPARPGGSSKMCWTVFAGKRFGSAHRTLPT